MNNIQPINRLVPYQLVACGDQAREKEVREAHHDYVEFM